MLKSTRMPEVIKKGTVGPHPENPATALYFFLEGLEEVGNGRRVEVAGKQNSDEKVEIIGQKRKERGLNLMDNAIWLARLQRERKL